MKRFSICITIIALFSVLQGCSWIVRFLAVNSTDKPIMLELKLKYPEESTSIFYYREFYLYEGGGKALNSERQTELKPDTLENRSHMKIVIPAHCTLEIGRLFNDTYDKYNQLFINGHVFSMEELKIIQADRETKMVPSTFDKYFKKGTKGDVFYFVK